MSFRDLSHTLTEEQVKAETSRCLGCGASVVDPNKCIGCGICTKVCPKKCLHMEGQKSVWEPEGCMMCMACIHACPMMAIQMRMPEKNPKARYRNENISICEIVDANNQWGEENPQ